MTGSQSHASPESLTGGVSIDTLFRANVAARRDAIAAADPSNRSQFTDGKASRLTFAEMDARVDRLARLLQSFGMPPGSVVAIQLPNIVELPISILAAVRAGFVAAPVPTLWRRSDLVAALNGVSPRAVITLSRLNEERPAEILCEAAAELFELSFPCAFGENVPDGVLPLDRQDGQEPGGAPREAAPSEISLITFDADAEGFFAVGRTDAQWLAAGLGVLLEARIESGDRIVTTLPSHSLAGLGAAFVPWLLSGGALHLVHGHAPEAIAAADGGARAHVLAPAAALAGVARLCPAPAVSGIAVHRAARGQAFDYSGLPCSRIVDLHCFGEIGFVPLARSNAAQPCPIPVGPLPAPSDADSGPVVVEVKHDRGQLWLRGPIVSREAFPPGLGSYRTLKDDNGFVRTGYRCHSDGNGGLVVDAGPDRVISVGGLRFGLNDLQLRFSACTDNLTVTAIDDPLLGERLHIEASDRNAAVAALLAAGHSQLVLDAASRANAEQAGR